MEYINLHNSAITEGMISGAIFEFMRRNSGKYISLARAKYKLATAEEAAANSFKAKIIKVLKSQFRMLNSVCAVNAAAVVDDDLKIANHLRELAGCIEGKISEIEKGV